MTDLPDATVLTHEQALAAYNALPPEWRYLVVLDRILAAGRGEDPERTGPAYVCREGEYPLGSRVVSDAGSGNVIEYAEGDLDDPEHRFHLVLMDDGAVRAEPFRSLRAET